ncbi:hypothetical protein V7075_02235 [Neobacillus drentensis]|uniref:hypothetical protein n=1 Tax=Neobacillus drentensis TaxID=220684 RepID=UPI002FFD5BCA
MVCKAINSTDQWQAKFLPKMEEEDILITMADHGNDPTIGHSNHTREYIPILIAGHKVRSAHIGRRNSIADVGATLSEFFGLPQTEKWKVFLQRNPLLVLSKIDSSRKQSPIRNFFE